MKRALCLLSALLLLLSLLACGGRVASEAASGQAAQTAAPETADPSAPAYTPQPAVIPDPTPVPNMQSGAAQTLLFSEKGVSATLLSYAFTENQALELTVEARNETDFPAILFFSLEAVNGWSVAAVANGAGDDAAMEALRPELAAGAAETLTLTFRLTDPSVARMGIAHVRTFTVNVWASNRDSTDYLGDATTVTEVAEAGDYVQNFEVANTPLLQNDFLYAGVIEADAAAMRCTLLLIYPEREGSTLWLQPVVNGYAAADAIRKLGLTGSTAAILELDLSAQAAALGRSGLSSLSLGLWMDNSAMEVQVLPVPLTGVSASNPVAEGPTVFQNDAVVIRFDGVIREENGARLALELENLGATFYMSGVEDYVVTLDGVRCGVEGYALLFPGTRTKLSMPVLSGTEPLVLTEEPRELVFSMYFAKLKPGAWYFESPFFTKDITITI